MSFKIKYLPETIIDREKIRLYLSTFYAGTSRKFFALLKEKTARLKEFPYSCPVYEDESDYRKLIVDDYLVFYIVNEGDNIIEIHRIIHGSKNLEDVLRFR